MGGTAPPESVMTSTSGEVEKTATEAPGDSCSRLHLFPKKEVEVGGGFFFLSV